MSTVEKIIKQVKKLPEPFQEEVLDFVEFLTNKISREALRIEDVEWSRFSLESALRGLDEDEADYDESDLKEKWA